MTSDTAQVLVLYRAPGRTLALLVITLGWGLYLGLHFALRPLGIWWLDALGVLVAALFGYFGLANGVLLVRGIPLLMAGKAGILIDNGWGQMFVEWPDIVEFS